MASPCDLRDKQFFPNSLVFPDYLICSLMFQNVEAMPGCLRPAMQCACIVLNNQKLCSGFIFSESK